MSPIYITVFCLLGAVLAQSEDFTLPDNITLPPELQAKLNGTDIEGVKTKYLEQFKKKCEQNGHPEAFDDVQNAVQTLMACTSALIDMNTLQNEIEEAKPTGKVDEVFKKYCSKTPEFKNCIRNMTETVRPCFAPNEQKNFKTLYNVTDQLTEFICFKDGDRIALFIAEGGKECFQDQQPAIEQCLNQTFDAKIQSDIQKDLQNITLEALPELEFKEKQCTQMSDLKKCVVSVLERCAKPTSANIVESLFNFIRKATPCKNFAQGNGNSNANGRSTETASPKGAASGIAITLGTVFMALAAAMLI